MTRWIDDGVKAVFFDAVGTILFPDPPVSRVYGRIAQEFGGDVPDPDQLRQQFRASFKLEEERDRLAEWRTSEDWEVTRWRRIVGSCMKNVSDAEGAFQALFQHFATSEAWKLHPETDAVLSELERRGLVIGMGSNYDARLQSVVAGHEPLKKLQHVVISSLVGWRKPGRGFFDAVHEATGLPAESILFVGDDVQNDYEGAKAVGMRVVLLDPLDQHPEVTDRIRTLSELVVSE